MLHYNACSRLCAVSSFGVILPLVLGRKFKSAFFLARCFGVRNACESLCKIQPYCHPALPPLS